MLIKSVLVFFLLALFIRAEVVVLDDSNFTSFIEQHPYVLVQFYAPWCGHCKALAPQYEKLSLLAEGKPYVIAKVDATIAEKTSAQFQVEGYPTIKFIAQGFPIDYKEGRTADDMQEWLESFFSSKIASLTEVELKEKIGSQDFLLIQGASTEQLKVLEIANFVDQSVPYYSLSEGEYRITLYLKKDSKILDYSGNVNVKELTAWALQNSLPSIVPLNGEQQTRSVFQNDEKLPAFLLYRAGNDFSGEAFARLETLCETNRAIYRCAYVDSTSSLFSGVGRYLKTTEPVTVLAYIKYGLKEGYKFPNPAELTGETITQFLEDVKEGKIPKYIDTEKEKKDKEVKYVNVVKLTAETYNSTIKDNKHVFIEYYSPSCGHCVRFAPEYEKLATKVKEEGLPFVIAAVDLVAQSQVSEWVSIQGYPTLRFFINGKAIDYSGERDSQEILKFINSAINTKLLTATSLSQVTTPAVIITGVAEGSDLNLLPLLFTRHPIYLLPGDDFKVEVHSAKGVQTYSGDATLDAVSSWLDDTTEPLIVGVVDQHPTKRLSKALQGQAPLLVVVKRDDTALHVLSVLEEYCVGKQVVCGYAGKDDQDYQSFSDWLGDKNTEKTLLVYIDTTEFKKTIYEGDLAALNQEQLSVFVDEAAKKEEVKEETKQEVKEEAQEATETQEETKEEVKEETKKDDASSSTEEL